MSRELSELPKMLVAAAFHQFKGVFHRLDFGHLV
jgi:hypothetical protein